MITQQQLTSYLNKPIAQICPNHYDNAKDNHCAHFVAHVMGYQFGATCRMMGGGQQPGANIRVQEIFPRCPTVGAWAARPSGLTPCLVFITNAGNVNLAAKIMSNVPRKHIGIFFNGMIYHYSNSQHRVVQQLPDQFVFHYAAPDNAMFYGSLLP
jgi:hypothetical protein